MFKNDALEIDFPSIQAQHGGVDCGLFAIADACELCHNTEVDLSFIQYNQQKMRRHMIKCLESGILERFPKQKKKPKMTISNCIRMTRRRRTK